MGSKLGSKVNITLKNETYWLLCELKQKVKAKTWEEFAIMMKEKLNTLDELLLSDSNPVVYGIESFNGLSSKTEDSSRYHKSSDMK